MVYQIIVLLLLWWHFLGDDMGAGPGLIFVGTLCWWGIRILLRFGEWVKGRIARVDKYFLVDQTLFGGDVKSPLWIRKTIGFVSRQFYPGMSICGYCGCNWVFARFHNTPYEYGEDNTCSILCEVCWRDLTPEQRLPYYRDLCEHWRISGGELHNGTTWEQVWKEMKTAVLAGL